MAACASGAAFGCRNFREISDFTIPSRAYCIVSCLVLTSLVRSCVNFIICLLGIITWGCVTFFECRKATLSDDLVVLVCGRWWNHRLQGQLHNCGGCQERTECTLCQGTYVRLNFHSFLLVMKRSTTNRVPSSLLHPTGMHLSTMVMDCHRPTKARLLPVLCRCVQRKKVSTAPTQSHNTISTPTFT